MSAPNFYEILGVSRDATEAEIKAAFRRKAKDAQPVVFGETKFG